MAKAPVHGDSRASEAKVQKILPQSGLTLRSSVHITRTFICGDPVALCSGLVLVVLCLGFCDSATVSEDIGRLLSKFGCCSAWVFKSC